MNHKIAFAVGSMALLAACGNDTYITQVGIAMVKTGDKISVCSNDNSGEMSYVADSGSVYLCNGKDWVAINGKDGADGKDGVDGKDGKDGADGKDGKPGTDGADGKPGTDGKNGTDGSDGKDGLSAYEIAVKNGYEGSEKEWAELLIYAANIANSSSSVASSSSEPESSSSSAVNKDNWKYLNQSKTYGEFVDERDGQVYKTIVIGSQTWFAENLNYKVLGSYCYDDNTDACDKFGRLYTWGTAKTSCPTGWHLPSKEEYATMYSAASRNYSNILSANYGGGNSSGFSLLYGGARGSSGSYTGLEGSAYLWTSSMGSEKPYSIGPFVVGDSFYTTQYYGNSAGLTVRCLKD